MEAHSNDISSAIDNKSKKSRKPYTITKPRESWTDDEHHMFVEALKMYERDWKKIEGHVKTKTVIQIRSHAQKYFIKMQKTGKVEMIPPPRPKRRSKKPYPKSHAERKRKMNDDAPFMNSISNEYMHQPYPYGIASGVNAPTPPQTSSHDVGHALHWAVWERKQLAKLRQGQLTQAQYYLQQAISAHTSEETANDTKQTAKPNFQRIYSFLGSLFDPSTTGHVLQLRTMDDMDRQVVQLLMQNLAANLGKHH